jgi:carbonic anhydrase
MSLLDDVLAANAAVLDRTDVPVPAVPSGKRVVIVTCSEIRAPGGRDLSAFFGFRSDETFVVANAGGRVRAPDGDVVRSVVAAIAQARGGEVFVVAHEGCEYLEADPESAVALVASPTSALLVAAETLAGENFIAARRLAIAAAETLRASPFLARTPVHALTFDENRGRLSAEQPGYGVAPAAGAAAPSAPSMGTAPSPILAAPGASSFGAAGPVSLFGSGPSSLMAAPSPDLGAGAAASFLSPPSPSPSPSALQPPMPVAPTPSFVMPPAPPVAPPTFVMPAPPPPPPPSPAEPPPLEPLTFGDVPPPPPPRAPARPAPPAEPRPASSDDPFQRAKETLERLRRERRK